MKKTLKSLSLIIVFLAIAIVPVLAGCAKTYTVDISITGGNQNGGIVTHNRASVYGKNAVTEGDDFVFTISALTGHYIKNIKIDGTSYAQSYDKYSYEFCLEDVKKDTSIEVTFDLDTFVIEIYCAKYSGGTNIGWGENPIPYKTYTIKYGNTFNGLLEFGASDNIFFYVADEQTQTIEYIDTTEGLNIWSVGKKGQSFKVYTLKTEAELDALASVE